MRLKRALRRWPAAVVMSTAMLSGASHGDASAQTNAPTPGPDEVQVIAEEGYIYP